MCRVLKVSRSGYYDWKDRSPSKRDRENTALTEKIREIHDRSRGIYGYPRVHAELRALGVLCSRKRVARLMRKAALQGCIRGCRKRTTRRDEHAVPAPDLVGRNFAAAAPNKVWTADITYVHTLRRAFCIWPSSSTSTLGGWSAGRWPTICVRNSWSTLWRWPSGGANPQRGWFTFRQGCAIYLALLRQAARRSRYRALYGPGGIGAGYNAISESFVASVKCELLYGHRFPSREAARIAIFDYIEGFYNRVRRHSSLGYLSPDAYEQATIEEVAVA
jgi:putative transposase